jgi:hypothetical protein
LGREVEFYNRVDSNDPANSAFILIAFQYATIVADSTLKDYATVAAIIAGGSLEVTNAGYARKTLTDANLTAYTVDNSQDRIVLSIPTQTFAAVSAGDIWGKLVIAYDPDTTAGTDTTLIPVTAHDLRISGQPITPNGSDIVIGDANGFVICD